MTARELAEIKTRCEAASKGLLEWRDADDGEIDCDDFSEVVSTCVTDPAGNPIIWSEGRGINMSVEDWEFTEHARTDIPALLFEIEKLQKDIKYWKRESQFINVI